MRTLHLHLLLSFLMSSNSFIMSHPRSIFKEMFEMLEEIEQVHEQMEKRFSQHYHELGASSFSSKSISMKMKEETLEIAFAYNLPKDRNFDAQFDQERNVLNISTASGKVSIHAQQTPYKQTCITALFKYQEPQQVDKDKMIGSLYSHSEVTQTIEGEIELAHATIDYDIETQELIITIPQRKKVRTKIPVNFKEPKEGK
ncbi:MAG: hypothetical protein AMXMBFR12_01910 [Candidatus Babeliales bacterium]